MEKAVGTSDGTARQSNLKLLVLGATGATGLEVVRHATERAHSVTPLVRAPDRLAALKNQITVKKGDLLDSFQVSLRGLDHYATLMAMDQERSIRNDQEDLILRSPN